MTNRRVIVWLVVAILLTALAHALLSYRGRVENALVQRTVLFDAAVAESADRIEIDRAGQVRSAVVRAGDWRLAEPYASAVDQQTVSKLLGLLQDAAVENAIGDRDLRRLGRTRGDFGLSSPRLVVTVAGGGAAETVAFGRETPDGAGVYASVAGEQAVYVVSSAVFAAADLPPEGLRSRALFSDDLTTADSLDVKRGTGSFVRFTRDGELWRMTRGGAEVAASADRVNRLLAILSGVSAVGFAWPRGEAGEPASVTSALLATYGLDPADAVTVTVKRKGLPDLQAAFGKESEEGLVYALVPAADAVVTVRRRVKDAALADLSAFADDRLFPYDLAQAQRLSVADGETAYLLSRDLAGAWVLDAPVVAPTDPATVARLFANLAGLKAGDTNGVTLAVSAVSGAEPVAVSREAALGGLRLEDLRSREILRIDPEGVRRLAAGGAGRRAASVVYDRDRLCWNVEGDGDGGGAEGVVDADHVAGALAALNPLRAEWIVKMKVSANDLRNYGLETPRLTLAVDQMSHGSVRRNILIGNDAQGGSFATVGSSDAVFVLSDDVVRRLSAPLVTTE